MVKTLHLLQTLNFGKLFNLLVLQFPHLQPGKKNGTHLSVLREWHEIIHIKCLAGCPSHCIFWEAAEGEAHLPPGRPHQGTGTAARVQAAEQDQSLFKQRQGQKINLSSQIPSLRGPSAAAAADPRLAFTCPQCEKAGGDKRIFSITPTQSQQSRRGGNSESWAAIFSGV